MKLPFIFKSIDTKSEASSSSSWPWPSCHQPRTLSFRTTCADVFKPEYSSWFTNSSESESASFSTEDDALGGDLTETAIRGLRSERLFFKPGETNSILEEATKAVSETVPFKESLVMSMESRDPYVDFRRSMEEMVEAHGLKEWDNLEELLCWYLRVNGKHNHAYIVGAFVDLFVGLAIAAPPNSTSKHCDHHHQDSPSSPLSFYPSSSLSYDKEIREIEEDDDDIMMVDVHGV